jgi:hypothetical protein
MERRGVKIQLSTESSHCRGPTDGHLSAPGVTGENMDNNIKALLHVQSSLLLAMCATHADAQTLERSFDFHLQQSKENVSASAEMSALIDAWAKTFRLRLKREASPPESEQTPPTAD